MRNYFNQILTWCLLIVLATALNLTSTKAAPISSEEAIIAIEDKQRLVAEILQIDTKLVLLRADKAQAEARLEKLKTDLNLAQQEKSRLTTSMAKEEEIVGQWLRFLVEEGSLTYLDVLLSATNLTDFLNRLDIIITLVDSNVRSLRQLQALTEQVEAKEEAFQARLQDIAATHATIEKNLQQTEQLRLAKSLALAEAEKKLADFPAVLALSQTWEQVLPDIDHCLNRLSKLPWSTIRPDNVQLDYLRGQATVTFKDSTLEDIVNRSLSLSDRFRLRCQPGFMILERPKLNYTLSFTIRPDKRRIIFEPHSVTISDTQIPDSALELLFKDRDLSLNIPLVAGLEITEAEVTRGEVQIFLRRG